MLYGGSGHTYPQGGEKFNKAKWLSEEVLQIDEKKREVKGKGDGNIYPSESRVPENNREIRRSSE